MRLSDTPWTNPSHDDQRTHAILHAVKAAGKLAGILEEEGHGALSEHESMQLQQKYAADLVISAIRLADVCNFSLEYAVRYRQDEKNGTMPSAPGSY